MRRRKTSQAIRRGRSVTSPWRMDHSLNSTVRICHRPRSTILLASQLIPPLPNEQLFSPGDAGVTLRFLNAREKSWVGTWRPSCPSGLSAGRNPAL